MLILNIILITITILLLLYTIKLIKKEKSNKTGYTIIMQIILIAVFISISVYIHNTVFETVKENTGQYSNIFDGQVGAILYNNSGNPASATLQGISESTDDLQNYNLRNIAFSLQIFDKDNNLVFQTPEKGNIIFFYNDKTQKNDMLNINDFFNEDELKSLTSYFKHVSGWSDVTVESITGYYKNNNFMIEEMELTDTFGKDLTLGEVKHKNSVTRYNKSWFKGTNRSKEDCLGKTQEAGKFWIYYFNTDSYHYNNMIELANQNEGLTKRKENISDCVDFWCASSSETLGSVTINADGCKNLESNYSYILLTDVDEEGIMDDLSSWKEQIIFTGCLMECFGLSMVILYTNYTKKKRLLEQTRNTFINAMAHEMKTPAAVILNGCEVLQENVNPEKHDHYIEIIKDESIHLNNLLQQMLTYTRTNETKELEKETAEAKTLVDHVLKHYDFSNYELITDIQDSTIECNPSLIEMAMDNFISNALRYSNHTVKITYKDGTFSVYNSEKPISKETIKHLWEPLYKGDDSRNDTSTSGMGLAISANILKLHKFKYGVKQDDTGITFYFIVK